MIYMFVFLERIFYRNLKIFYLLTSTILLLKKRGWHMVLPITVIQRKPLFLILIKTVTSICTLPITFLVLEILIPFIPVTEVDDLRQMINFIEMMVIAPIW